MNVFSGRDTARKLHHNKKIQNIHTLVAGSRWKERARVPACLHSKPTFFLERPESRSGNTLQIRTKQCDHVGRFSHEDCDNLRQLPRHSVNNTTKSFIENSCFYITPIKRSFSARTFNIIQMLYQNKRRVQKSIDDVISYLRSKVLLLFYQRMI